ncbi:MAG: DUF192 domain-containing protein [Candidatus Woesearchaeota archaeon]
MIINKSRNRVLAKNSRILDSFLGKARGLMFHRRISKEGDGYGGYGLVFPFDSEARRSIHMFFVFFPIDVLFLDRKRRVVEVKERLKPFSICLPKKKSKYIIELPAGVVSSTALMIGDIINFK